MWGLVGYEGECIVFGFLDLDRWGFWERWVHSLGEGLLFVFGVWFGVHAGFCSLACRR